MKDEELRVLGIFSSNAKGNEGASLSEAIHYFLQIQEKSTQDLQRIADAYYNLG